jgi:peptidoglycan/LPS O-acetylase OafA/YrhL
VARPARADHFPCFDGLRALAALLVIGVHTALVSGFTGRDELGRYTARLEIGVPVFFVISGFLLYRPFAFAHFSGSPNPPTRAFWVRRLKRIVPAYWAAFLIITFVLRADFVLPGWGSLAVYLGFAQIYIPSYSLTGVTQAWSLCTEMSFYLALPLWAALMGRRLVAPRRQLRAELLGLAGLVLLSVGFRSVVLNWHSELALTMPNWLPAYADLFALGMLLAVLSSWLAVENRRPRLLWHPATPWISWGLAAGLFVAVSNIGLPLAPLTASPVPVALARQTLYGLFAFFVVLPAVFGAQDRGLIRQSLRFRPVALVGVVSYGVYLWHESWITMFQRWTGDRTFTIPFPDLFVPVTLLAIAAATVSYVLVERPIRLARRRSQRRPALSSAAVPT